MNWNVEYIKDAADDLERLDHSQAVQVVKAIIKVSANPLPNTQGGFGKPLRNGSTSKLSGCCKIKLKKLGLRVVYQTITTDKTMKIIVISVRAEDSVYDIAANRLNNN